MATLPDFFAGEVSVQDRAAQMAAELMELTPELRVLDACSAPGGKLCHLLETEPSIQVVALEIAVERVKKINENLIEINEKIELENASTLPSATPSNRFFGFTHVLDGGWTADHYCRSWELLGLHQFGPIVNVDQAKPPFGNTRRLITDADVKKDANRAHSSSVPGGAAVKDASGKFIHEEVWHYLFTHPVEQTGEPVAADPDCRKDLRKVKK